MKSFFRFALMSAIFSGLLSIGWTQEASKTQAKTETKTKTQAKVQTQSQNVIHGPNFVDENGDGYNDNAPDHDGDGIPNGQDADYQGAGKGKRQQRFVDTNGDGIADNVGTGSRMGYGKKGNRRGGYGPGNGTGNQGVRPQNGTGFGPGAGTGTCDGTGPKGRANRSGANK